MKRILLLMVFMFGASLFDVPVFNVVTVVTPAIAQSCDEFHGIPCADCRFSIFNPCCPWWEPWRCAATKQRKKDVAAYVEDYVKRRVVDMAAISTALAFVPGGGTALKQLTGPVTLALAVYGERSSAVRKDPFRWDFLEFYQGGDWPSADSVGMQYTGWWWNDQLVELAQGVSYYTDYITNEADRFTSCKQMGLECPDWYADRHKENVAWGFYMFGYYHGALGDHLWNTAALVEQEGLDDPALLDYAVSVLRDAASAFDYAESEYENDWD
jgi:hypothetical protein